MMRRWQDGEDEMGMALALALATVRRWGRDSGTKTEGKGGERETRRNVCEEGNEG